MMPNVKACMSCGEYLPASLEFFRWRKGKVDVLGDRCRRCSNGSRNARRRQVGQGQHSGGRK